jgi:deoxyadenosine/deoxycytidine kinase
MFVVEGNIGAGKSTFLGILSKKVPGLVAYLEPKENWMSSSYGESLLANFYSNPKRWAYTMETVTLMTRVKHNRIIKRYKNTLTVTERSVYSGYYCFASNGYESGFLTKTEWQIYESWIEMFLTDNSLIPTGFVYIRTSPENCFERIMKRGRSDESEITLSYIKQIDKKHDQFLITGKHNLEFVSEIPVLVLDGNRDFLNDEKVQNEMVDAFIEFALSHMTDTELKSKIEFRKFVSERQKSI